MTFTKKIVSFTVAAMASLVLAACADQMQPAKVALDGVDSAITAASAEAGKYVPEQLTAVQLLKCDYKRCTPECAPSIGTSTVPVLARAFAESPNSCEREFLVVCKLPLYTGRATRRRLEICVGWSRS